MSEARKELAFSFASRGAASGPEPFRSAQAAGIRSAVWEQLWSKKRGVLEQFRSIKRRVLESVWEHIFRVKHLFAFFKIPSKHTHTKGNIHMALAERLF